MLPEGPLRVHAGSGRTWASNSVASGHLRLGLAAVLAATVALAAAPVRPTDPSAATPVSVIVRAVPGALDEVGDAVARLGGTVTRELGIIDGVAAVVPASAIDDLAGSDGVRAITPDGSVTLHNTIEPPALAQSLVQDIEDDHKDKAGVDRTIKTVVTAAATAQAQAQENLHTNQGGGWRAVTGNGSTMTHVAATTGAIDLWRRGITGKGVGVALIDSGVVGVDGLTSGNVVNGPDLSFESQIQPMQYLDSYGHGTHMAGIIAGKSGDFSGMAPDAKVLSLKVATADGATDVSQVIAAIDWIVQHRNDNGMNIRVLNLSFGTDGQQDYRLDPLAYAAEVAWHRGIVVVVAAGNAGFGSPRLNNPATDPYVISVGAVDTKGTWNRGDDVVPEFSSRGDDARRPDLAAPGKSIESLRVPGSYLDMQYPVARVGERFFKGSGTSQAAAVVSGAAALLLQQRPELTNDQVKALLMKTARPVGGGSDVGQGSGMVNLWQAAHTKTPDAVQTYERSTGLGSIEAARGSNHVASAGVELRGEYDIFGAWDGAKWAPLSAAGASWSGGMWNGASWSGASWSGASWSGASWSGASWSGASWSGASWSGASWSGASWSGASWSGASWSGASWSGASWSGASWSGASWSGASWSGASWSGASWSGTSWAGTSWAGTSWAGTSWG